MATVPGPFLPEEEVRVKIVIFGAGNLLLSDEGFGVHLIRHLEERYSFPDEVELFDGGTLGIFAAHKLEEADVVYLVDGVAAEGAPGEIRVYEKEDFLLNRIPLKMSPHQLGIQEVLLMAEMRGRQPADITLVGVIPETYVPGMELSETLRPKLDEVAAIVLKRLKRRGVEATALGAPR
jgi:hydrogenase maturation protease